MAERANFREAYESKAKVLRDNNQLPEFVAKNKSLLKERYITAKEAEEISHIECSELICDGKENYNF